MLGCGVLPLVFGQRRVPVGRTCGACMSTRPYSKQRLAPRWPVWSSKVVLNGSTRKKNGMRLVLLSIAFVWLAERPRLESIGTENVRSRFFFTPFRTKKVIISVSGARCGACSARPLRKFALNVRALCMRRCWDGFDTVWLPLSLL